MKAELCPTCCSSIEKWFDVTRVAFGKDPAAELLLIVKHALLDGHLVGNERLVAAAKTMQSRAEDTR